MKKIFFIIAIFVTLLFTFSSCMSTRHLNQTDPYGEVGHANHGGGNYSNSGGGDHSGGCH